MLVFVGNSDSNIESSVPERLAWRQVGNLKKKKKVRLTAHGLFTTAVENTVSSAYTMSIKNIVLNHKIYIQV